jgi:hypothetical protein
VGTSLRVVEMQASYEWSNLQQKILIALNGVSEW